jgi:acyl-CoA synthetase (NDP forming)
MSVAPRLSVREILHPRSVAVFGASEDKGKFGGRILYYLMRHRFGGRIVPINPNRKEVAGLPCFSSVDAAGEAPDVAILAIPAGSILPSVEACARAGVGCCVIVSTGFAEADEAGAAVQASLVALCRETGMHIVGPNCMGLINPHHALALSSSLVLEIPEMRRGSVGLVSQSGALMVSMFDRAHDAGVGFSACVSLGNQADLEICDFFEHFIADPQTEVICMYIEGLKDGQRFMRLAERAQAAGKPVLAVKTGRTDAGVKAARSHTGSLAGSYAVFEAVCRERGVLLMDDVDGMLIAADLLARHGRPRAHGVGVFSPSGGGAGIGVDRLASAGQRLARLSSATRSALLEHLLPPQADNPIDTGGRLKPDAPGSAAAIVEIFAADHDLGAILVMLTTTPRYEDSAEEIGQALLAAGKPFAIAVMPGHSADGVRARLAGIGCPYVDGVDQAVRALCAYLDHARLSVDVVGPALRPADLPAGLEIEQLPAGSHLAEHEVKALVRRYGIPVAREELCAGAEAAADAADRLGYPVALKAMSRDIVHKSDVGAVKLGLGDRSAVLRAWHEIEEAVSRYSASAQLDGGLVAQMVDSSAELIVGIKHDDQFGPMILVGFGGVTVELVPDTVLASAPVSPEAALRLLRRLKQYPLLEGYRGRRRADLAAHAEAISRLSFLALDGASRIAELDLNPVLIRKADGRPVAVDARATLR